MLLILSTCVLYFVGRIRLGFGAGSFPFWNLRGFHKVPKFYAAVSSSFVYGRFKLECVNGWERITKGLGGQCTPPPNTFPSITLGRAILSGRCRDSYFGREKFHTLDIEQPAPLLPTWHDVDQLSFKGG